MRILLPVIVLILLFCISLNAVLLIGLDTLGSVEVKDNVFAQVVKENIKLRRHLYLADQLIKHIAIENKRLNRQLDMRYMLIKEVEL